ncbi:hypothetical protein [Methylosinus sp. Sm6]|uniref:hypothetical protein n=1 Tax=Methylosinus sp. Sm6 TaxID=2866948 RepID=UPI001C991494|nr:hypothetical protein [Methylosinus sp. Sm6]MBY6242849.1 hypothetical protein [Methylosinus sp. Sm6]
MRDEIAANLRLPDVYHPEQADHLPPDLIGATILRIGASPRYLDLEGGGLVIEYRPNGQSEARRIVIQATELGMWLDDSCKKPREAPADMVRVHVDDGREMAMSKDAHERGVSALVRGLGGGKTYGPWDHDRMVVEIFAAMTGTPEMTPRFSMGDTVYRHDSGDNAATVLAIEEIDGETVYRLAYAEGGVGHWPESAIFATLAERDATIGG